ncbi:MAG TPA: cell division protein FtsA, partial [Flavobacterium sp.]
TPLVELQKPIEQPVMRPQPVINTVIAPEPVYEEEMETVAVQQPDRNVEESTEKKVKRSFFDKYIDKIKDFLDNAE